MVVAELTVIPLAAGVDMRPFVDAALGAIKGSGLKYEVGALGTTLEGDLDQVFVAVKAAHQAVMQAGSERVITELRIDDRKAGDVTIARELAGYR